MRPLLLADARISILCSAMAVGLKSLFWLVLDITLCINENTVLSHSHESYSDALRNNRGKLKILLLLSCDKEREGQGEWIYHERLASARHYRRRRRRSGIAGAGLSLYARLISHFNITNMVFNYI